MKFIAIMFLAFSSVSQAALTLPITLPNVRTIENYKNQICNQSCTDGVLKMSFMQTGESSGAQKCPAQAAPADLTISCGAYLCAPNGKNCAVSCENNYSCSAGYFCENSRCIPERPISYFCSADRSVSSTKGESWDCSPMICQAGRCKEKCVTTNDCVAGAVCDTSHGSCVFVR